MAMTRVISVLNYKGGTGKTTTVINVAAGLALRGHTVLCVDLDIQSSLGTSLGVTHPRSVADVLLGYHPPEACIVPAREHLDLILSDDRLLRAEGELWRMGDDRAARRVLAYSMQSVQGYDYIFLDCSHSMSLVTQNALLYATELLVPVSMNYLAMIGTRQVLDTLKDVGRIPGHRLKLAAIVPTMYYGRFRKDREVLALLQRYFGDKVTPPIRTNVRLAEAAGHQQTIYEYAPTSHGALDYAQLVEWMVNHA